MGPLIKFRVHAQFGTLINGDLLRKAQDRAGLQIVVYIAVIAAGPESFAVLRCHFHCSASQYSFLSFLRTRRQMLKTEMARARIKKTSTIQPLPPSS